MNFQLLKEKENFEFKPALFRPQNCPFWHDMTSAVGRDIQPGLLGKSVDLC